MSFSPLEALLLFQHLSNHGVSPTVFPKISDLLKNDMQIRRATSFDPARLSADALRDFYLRLLKEEARNELNKADGNDGTNGDVPAGSRKRKAPSPTLPTVQEASNNAHLLPQLIRKLYARYREHAIIEIKEEERRYEKMRQDINEIDSGAWDEKLQREIERGDWNHVIKAKSASQEKSAIVNGLPATADLAKQPGPKPETDTKRPYVEIRHQSASNTVTTPTISPYPPKAALPSPSPGGQSALPPRSSPQPPIHPAHSAPLIHPSPAHAPQAITPRPPEGQSPGKPGQSPSMLPPPPPANLPSQTLPPYPYSNSSAQKLPANLYTAQQPQSPQLPSTGPNSQQIVQSPSYAMQPNKGGMMLQPFAVAPQTPTGPQRPGHPPVASQSSRPGVPPRFPPTSTLPGTALSPLDVVRLLSTPLTAKNASSTAAPSPSMDTRWKPLPGKAKRAMRKTSPERPREISPISDRELSPPTETLSKPRRSKPPTSAPESTAQARNTRTRRGRGGSTTSSVHGSSVRGRTRSQSVMSLAEDVSMVDVDSVAGRRVKHEPSTPQDGSDLPEPTIEETPSSQLHTTRRAGPQSGLNKRKRGPRDESEVSEQYVASKQDKSIVNAHRSFHRLSATVMNDIQSHRHGSLFSAPVRDKDAEGYSDIIRRPQDLKSIRSAITAGNRAVNAATASDSFSSSVNSQREGGGSIMLPVSEDLVPPKAIVNSAQLEKEIMRMFANAVMFNPGDEGVVRDAREMAEDVEKNIAKFRDVERSSITSLPTVPEDGSRRQSDALAVEEEDVAVGKRRRLG